MATTILTKRSNTASAVPLSADLTNSSSGSELAVNTADKRLFTKNSGGTVVELGTNPSSLTMSGGTANGVAYLNGSKVVTSGSALTFDGTNIKVATSGITANAYLAGFSLTFDRNADNYIYAGGGASSSLNLNADNSLKFNVGSGFPSTPEIMRLTSTGLGIGTSSPSSKLDISNTSRMKFNVTSTTNAIEYWKDATPTFAASTGTGTATGLASAYKVDIFNGSAWATATTIDVSGNLGLGVTPSAWVSSAKVFEVGSTGSFTNSGANDTAISDNRYYNGTNNIYKTTNPATIYSLASGQHRWFNAPSGTAGNAITFTQAATLTADGNYLVGTTSQLYGERLNATNGGSGKNAATFYFTTSDDRSAIIVRHDGASGATSRKQIAFLVSGGTEVGNIASTGSVTVYNTTSDYRLKNNQLPLINSGDFIDALKPKTWNWAKDGSKGVGFIAHEFAEVSPSSVRGEKDAVDANGNPVYQSMQASSAEVIANLVAEIQSLRQRVATLEAK